MFKEDLAVINQSWLIFHQTKEKYILLPQYQATFCYELGNHNLQKFKLPA